MHFKILTRLANFFLHYYQAFAILMQCKRTHYFANIPEKIGKNVGVL